MEKVIKTPIPVEKYFIASNSIRFNKKVRLLSVQIPIMKISEFVTNNYAMKALLYKRHGIRPVIDCPVAPGASKPDKKRILFSEQYQKPEDLPSDIQAMLGDYLKTSEPYELELKYENFDANEVLRELLPKTETVPTGYEIVGTILHFNLPESLLPYKNIIGQVYLDKTKGIKTVVTKIDHIESVFRFYKMEVLAGECNFVTRQREYDCIFELDLSKVYWCSRLSTERRRMVNMIPQNSVLCDMFCGVGPLTIQVAKYKKCRVLANDLNPDCVAYLKKNMALNKVEDKVLPFNMDAREFARMAVEGKDIPKEFAHFDHVYMNLPVDAVEFLDVFCGLFAKADTAVWNETNLPTIHVYAFTEQEDLEEAKVALCERINNIFGKYKPLVKEDITSFHQIRDVSAKSKMYAVTFKLSKEVAYGLTSVQIEPATVEIPKKHPPEESVSESIDASKKPKNE